MKRVFALLLALGLLLFLAACGEPEPTGTKKPGTTTSQLNTSVTLVTAYESDNSLSMGNFAMAFTYNSDCRGGTAVVRADGKEQQLLKVDTTTVITYVYTADGRLQEQKTTENGTVTTTSLTTFETVEIKN